MIRAVDVSAWSGPISFQQCVGLREAGVGMVIVQLHGGGPDGTGFNPHAPATLEATLDAGLLIAGYVWPSWSWMEALNNIQPFQSRLQFLALDVEADAPVHRDQIVGIRSADHLPVIYTSRGAWQSIMGVINLFDDVPLWDASYWSEYDANTWPPHLGARWVPYGGWTSRSGWQFKGSTDYLGVHCDLNVFDEAFVGAQGPVPPSPDLAARVAALESLQETLEARLTGVAVDVARQNRILARLREALDAT